MKKINLPSFGIGFVAAIAVTALFAFSSNDSTTIVDDGEIGRYQISGTGTPGYAWVLDTKRGKIKLVTDNASTKASFYFDEDH
jgi:uncharacterized Fe-S cluster-containing protein